MLFLKLQNVGDELFTKILEQSKLITFAGNTINGTQKWKNVEKIVGKGENSGCHYFLVFPLFFKGLLLQGHENQRLLGKG